MLTWVTMSTLQERLETANAKQQLDVVEIARIAGVSRQAAQKWLDGLTKEISATPLFRLAHHFNVDPEWLGTGAGGPTPQDRNEHMHQIAMHLSESMKRAQEAFVEAHQQLQRDIVQSREQTLLSLKERLQEIEQGNVKKS